MKIPTAKINLMAFVQQYLFIDTAWHNFTCRVHSAPLNLDFFSQNMTPIIYLFVHLNKMPPQAHQINEKGGLLFTS